MVRSEKAILFWSNGDRRPSFRHRWGYLVPEFRRRGWSVEVEGFPRRRLLLRIVVLAFAMRRVDVLVLQKMNVTMLEGWLLRLLARKVIFDFDDAVYLLKPKRAGADPVRSRSRVRRFATSCRSADLVIAGNSFLATQAAPFARRLEVVPTPVDCQPLELRDVGRTLVWIGQADNLMYLSAIRPAVGSLSRRFPGLRLRIICSDFPDWPEVQIEKCTWSERSEWELLGSSTVGLMPLSDDDWARGKCAFKILQYMAAGLPSVASPVGANRDAIVEGLTGFFAQNYEEWESNIARLLADPVLRRKMGDAARARAVTLYSRTVVAPVVLSLVESLFSSEMD